MGEELKNTAETTNEEVTSDAISTESEEVVDDADSDESVAEFSDNTENTDESDDGKTEGTQTESKGKPWKNEKNAKEAAKRREVERKAEIEKARNEAIIEALGGINPFTGEKMEDEADVKEYLTMKEIEKTGKDPIHDFSRFIKDKAKEQEKAERAKQSQEDWIRKDREEFHTNHPDVSMDELIGDEMFRTFATGKVGRVPMTQIYADYKAYEKKIEERAKTKAAQILANTAATPGKLSNQSPVTAKSVKDMSKAEFEVFVERVKRGEIK